MRRSGWQYPRNRSASPRCFLSLRSVCAHHSSEESSLRLYDCARCRVLVAICRRCDRGQIYCGHGCAEIRRRESVRKAAKVYQKRSPGAMNHARRQERYRQLQREVAKKVAAEEARATGHHLDDSSEQREPEAAAPAANVGRASENPDATGRRSVSSNTEPTVLDADRVDDHDGVDLAPATRSGALLAEKVTHQSSCGTWLRVSPRSLAPAGSASLSPSNARSTQRQSAIASFCHFCGRSASGFVRYGFLGSREVP